ncbi:hypothetical protein [Roseococcus sp. YIM B11640]|uniref:hypothetical protein n=1 Tax=Roseococcus sp. YIM B11640 TaxID=3133973 RepID=UPI003C7A8F68
MHSLTLFDIYVMAFVVYWPVAVLAAAGGLLAAFRARRWPWRVLGLLAAGFCLYPLLHFDRVY